MDNEIEINKKNSIETGLEPTNYLLMNSIKICDKYYNQIDKKLRLLIDSNRSTESTRLNESTNLGESISLNKQLEITIELKELEQQFWNDLKTFKETNESIVIQYIIGVYAKIQQITLLYLNLNKKNEIYFIHNLSVKSNEFEFLYNIYIHLGDLSRYQKSNKLAKQFYLKARTLNPSNGQSYNQLALIYSQDPIKSIYYYVRAYLAIEPSKIAFNNLKLSIKHFISSNQLIKLLFDCPSTKPDKIRIENWLYLIVIAVFADNMNSIIQFLFDDIHYWFKFKSISINSNLIRDEKDEYDHKCLFASFDLFLDYCSIYGLSSNSNLFSTKFNLVDYEKQLKEFKQSIDDYLNKVNLSCSILDPIALRHDYMLQGLQILQKSHSNLIFANNKDNKYACSLNHLICRIGFKLDQLIVSIDKKMKPIKQKKMRNIALQSILNANNQE